ncbi:MAG: DUF63 family protein [Candidatus Diapherotrites archaeon]|nr:DUF63 family protein [Candidatus Diapherotrites archaeon]
MDFNPGEFLNQYFITPVMNPEIQGYNIVNTSIYIALLALTCITIYLIFRKKIKFGEKFFTAMLPYILFGISLRVVMHQIESGMLVIEGITKTANPFELGFWFFTPGIWLLTFALVLAGLAIGTVWKKLDEKRVFIFGAVICAAPLLFNLSRFNNWPAFIATAIIIPIAAYSICFVINKFTKYKILSDKMNLLIVGGQAIDGIASTVAITFFNFSEQHFVSNAIIQISPILFVAVKLAIAVLICWSLDDYLKENGKRKNVVGFVKVIIAIIGFATGLASLFKLGII